MENSILIQLMTTKAARLWINYRSKLAARNKKSTVLTNAERPELAKVVLTALHRCRLVGVGS